MTIDNGARALSRLWGYAEKHQRSREAWQSKRATYVLTIHHLQNCIRQHKAHITRLRQENAAMRDTCSKVSKLELERDQIGRELNALRARTFTQPAHIEVIQRDD